MNDTFGTRLQIARKRAGFKTQQQLADAVDVTTRTIRNYEGDKHRPPPNTLDSLRKVLGEFDAPGDPVESAVKASRLTEDRQYVVLGTYKRQLREQDEESDRRGTA